MSPVLGPVSPSSMALWSCILQGRIPELKFGDDPCRWGEVAFACFLRWGQCLHQVWLYGPAFSSGEAQN